MRGSWLLLGLAACGSGSKDADDTDADTDTVDTDVVDTDVVDTDLTGCDARTGGALITFDVAGEGFTGWFTDDAFVDAAADHLANGTTQVPSFLRVIAGTDCDDQWGFHVDPADVAFADFTIELCDGTPSYVDQHLDDWIATVGSWCPWSAVVTAVDDRR